MAAEMLDRVNGPGVEWGETFEVPAFDQRVLPNGLPVWMLPEEEEGVVSLRLLFAVDGRWGITPAVAHGTMELMPRGAGAKSEQAIFEALDGWGSQVAFSYRLDYGMVWVRTLRQHFTDTIMLLREVLTQPAYAAESLSAWQNSEEAALRVSLQQPDTLAMRAQLDALYPRGHRYAAFSQLGDYQRVDTQALHCAHRQWIGGQIAKRSMWAPTMRHSTVGYARRSGMPLGERRKLLGKGVILIRRLRVNGSRCASRPLL